KKDMPFSFIITLALLFLSFSVFPSAADDNIISRADGIILLLFFSIFMYYTVRTALAAPAPEEDENTKIMPVWQQLLFIAIGIAGICIGGNRVVEAAKVIAGNFGMSDSLIGLTIVAIGTSLPELVTSIVAAKKGESDIAIGNVIGSNIFNILFVLGISSVITPIVINTADIINSMYDIIIVALATLVVYIPVVRTRKISRLSGSLMVIAYIVYTVYIIMR
ncbi:MAG: sodium:calcium antiporter, partial [Clostridia bacterium]|nr:sodium:calcium antiporter [Clostridia bacterium]